MKKFVLVLLLLSKVLHIYAQTNDNQPDLKHARPAFLDISVGVQYATFRDFATSPLFYQGRPIYLALAHLDLDAKRESSFRSSYSFGNFENERSVSKVQTFAINYLELFELRSWSSPEWNIKVGGQLNSTANIRNNEALGNNSDGFEVISTLFGSAKCTWNRNNQPKHPYGNLAFSLHLGVLNTAYRNGFIYTRQSPLLNQDEITDGYEFQWFSGFRMCTALDYTLQLSNGNAVQLSYGWDAYHTSGNYAPLEMATHLLTFTLLFNLK